MKALSNANWSVHVDWFSLLLSLYFAIWYFKCKLLQHATPLLLFWRTLFSNHHHYSAISTIFFADFSSIHAQLKMVWRRDAAIANVISWPNITCKSILREKGMVNFEVNHPIKKNVILTVTIVHGTEKTWFKSFQQWRFLLHGCCQFSKGVCRFGMKSVCSPELTAHAFFLHLNLGTFNAPFLEANILMKLRSKGGNGCRRQSFQTQTLSVHVHGFC